jgi:lipopolysaccharide export system protein LptC
MAAAAHSLPGIIARDPDRAARRALAYARALRHSRRVRWLKRAMPLGAFAGTAFLLVTTLFDPFGRWPKNVSIGAVSLSGTKIVMEAPRLQGFKRDARPFEVTAKSALQDIKSPHLIELFELNANMSMGPEGSATLKSPEGFYDSQKETLDLRKSVQVRTDTGYDVRLRSARIEFKTGHMKSAEPVTVAMNDGTIEADSMEIVDNGRVIVFEGRVRSVLVPPEEKTRQTAGTAAAQEIKQ